MSDPVLQAVAAIVKELKAEMREGFAAHQQAWERTLDDLRGQVKEAEKASTILTRRAADAQLNNILQKRLDECLLALRADARHFLEQPAKAEPSDTTDAKLVALTRAFNR